MDDPNPTQTDVAIVGAGVWGLSAAHFLSRRAPGQRLDVFEADRVAGGAIRTVRRGDYLFEPGPNSLLDNSPELRVLLAETGLAERVVPAREAAAKCRYIVRGGRLRRLPMSPPAFLKADLFSTGAKLRLLREPFVRPAPADAEETLEQFVLRRLGREFLDYAVDPFVSGTFAGLPAELCVRSAFRRLWHLEQSHGSLIRGAIRLARERRRAAAAAGADAGAAGAVQAGPSGRMLTFPDGLQTLVDTLARPLAGRLHTGWRLREVRRESGGFALGFDADGTPRQLRCRALLVTVAAYAWADVQCDFGLPRQRLAAIPYPPVVAVFFGFDQHPQAQPMDGFGFLVPRVERRHILGTLWTSSAYPGRAPGGGAAFTTYLGGRRQPEIAAWDDERIAAAVGEELRDLMGIARAPDLTLVHRWPRAIPQYVIGHRAAMADVDRVEERQPGLFVGGNFRGGISVGDCVSGADAAARRIAARLG